MDSTWEHRDLLVLDAAVRHFDDADAHRLDISDLVTATGLDEESVRRALRALAEARPAYLIGIDTAETRYPIVLTGITERARRAVGAWPTAEQLADRVAAAVAAAAETADDEEDRSRLRRLAAWVGGAGRDVLVEVSGAALGHAAGLS